LVLADRGDHFRFGSVFIKKSNQTEFFFEKNRNRTETRSNRPVSVRLGLVFLGKKPIQTGLARFFRFWLGFLGFGSVFSDLALIFWFGSVFPVWLCFGSIWLSFFLVFCRFRFGSVWFFRFFAYKTETEPASFFKNLLGFFSVRFFRSFFFRFSRFNRFSGFFAHLYLLTWLNILINAS
jgi:hypothetical protein